jgi:hypothetical protein
MSKLSSDDSQADKSQLNDSQLDEQQLDKSQSDCIELDNPDIIDAYIRAVVRPHIKKVSLKQVPVSPNHINYLLQCDITHLVIHRHVAKCDWSMPSVYNMCYKMVSETITYLDLSNSPINYVSFDFKLLSNVKVLLLRNTTACPADISDIQHATSLEQFDFNFNHPIPSASLMFPESLIILHLPDTTYSYYCETNILACNIANLNVNGCRLGSFQLSTKLVTLNIGTPNELEYDIDDDNMVSIYRKMFDEIRTNNMNLRTFGVDWISSRNISSLCDLIKQDNLITTFNISGLFYFGPHNTVLNESILQNKTITSVGYTEPITCESPDLILATEKHLTLNKNRNMTLCKLIIVYLSDKLNFIIKY